MISALNQLVDLVEHHLAEEPDVRGLAATLGTTEYHLRRMFSSLAGMPLSEYVRRRRMTVAAADVVRGEGDLLSIAVRHGYGSSEAFGRAFRAVHGAGPGDVRRDGGPLHTQPRLRFRLTVEGSNPMDTRLIDRPAFRLVGHAARVPLIHQGVNPHIQRHIAALPQEEHLRLKALGDTETGRPAAGLRRPRARRRGGQRTDLPARSGPRPGHGGPGRPRHHRGVGWEVGGLPHQRTASAGPADDLGGDRDRVVPFQPVAAAAGALDRRGPRARGRLQYRHVRTVAACRTGVRHHRTRLSASVGGFRRPEHSVTPACTPHGMVFGRARSALRRVATGTAPERRTADTPTTIAYSIPAR